MRKNKITDTAAEAKTEFGALSLMAQMMGDNTGETIYRQEKRGQQELVNSRELPQKCNGGRAGLDIFTIYEKMGIKILNKDTSDELFYECVLPTGWKVNGTGHSMWSELKDDKGRTRATIFYKAAFYDRDAFINIERRFSIDFHNRLSGNNTHLHANKSKEFT